MTTEHPKRISRTQQSDFSLLVAAIFTVILGICAIASPVVATWAVEAVVGTLMLLAGMSGLWVAWKLRSFSHAVWRFLSAACFLVLGFWILMFPLEGILTLTLLIGCAFIAEGICRLLFVPAKTPNRVWVMMDGVLGILLGVIVLSRWPADSAWVMGLLVGIRLVINGATLFIVRRELGAVFDQSFMVSGDEDRTA